MRYTKDAAHRMIYCSVSDILEPLIAMTTKAAPAIVLKRILIPQKAYYATKSIIKDLLSLGFVLASRMIEKGIPNNKL